MYQRFFGSAKHRSNCISPVKTKYPADLGDYKKYNEKKVNEILGRYHEDTATLRRELVGSKLMKREGGGGEYWREG